MDACDVAAGRRRRRTGFAGWLSSPAPGAGASSSSAAASAASPRRGSSRRADVEVTLVDPMSHHLFQPLLYQLACGGLVHGRVRHPDPGGGEAQRATSRVLMARATGLDAERAPADPRSRRAARLRQPDRRLRRADLLLRQRRVGASVSYGLKTLADAVALRNRIYGSFEEAERARGPGRARALADVRGDRRRTDRRRARGRAGDRHAAHDEGLLHARSSPARAKVILLDAGERVTAAFSPKLSAKVAGYLADLGVTVREHARVTAIDADGVDRAGRATRASGSTRGRSCGRRGCRRPASRRRSRRPPARAPTAAGGCRCSPT